MAITSEVLPSVEDLCEAFRSNLREWFPFEAGERIRKSFDLQNRKWQGTPMADCCASSDHCDANQAMVDAWEHLTETEPDADREDHATILNAAWNLAKRRGFADDDCGNTKLDGTREYLCPDSGRVLNGYGFTPEVHAQMLAAFKSGNH